MEHGMVASILGSVNRHGVGVLVQFAFATLCAYYTLFAVPVFVLTQRMRRTRKETQRKQV